MIKNTASQIVAFQMVSTTDGSAVTTGTPTVYVTGDGGAQGTGSGSSVHEGNGCWSYATATAETNYDHVAYTMVLTGAVSQTVNVYPFIQADYKADVSGIPTTSEFEARSLLSADYTIVSDLGTVQTGDSYSRIGANGASLTAINLPNQTMDITGNLSGSVGSVTDGVSLTDNAITAAKYDESTAFPIVTTDTGATEIARTGADSDTLEILSDEISSVQSSVDNIASGTAATNQVASSFTAAGAEGETNSYTDTATIGTVHIITPDTGTTDIYYEFDIGANGSPVAILWQGYAASQGDSWSVRAYNWGATTWEQIQVLSGVNGTTVLPHTFDLTVAHVGTAANLGKVQLKFYSTDGTSIGTDRILCSFATVYQSVGYAGGSLWYDDTAGNTNTSQYIDGTADNPVSTWAAIKTLIASTGIKTIHVANGSSLTLDANSDTYTFNGENYNLALGGQSIEGLHASGPNAFITGIATATVTPPSFENVKFGAVTLPPCGMMNCGFGAASGQFTAGSAGQYIIKSGFSLVPGSGSPTFVFTGLLSATGINVRGWTGGVTYTLDSDCTLSHEVLAGGSTTITTGGGDAEIRGITRSLTVTLSAAETVQFVGTTGPISLSGTTTATVNLYGISSELTDTTSAATVVNSTVSRENVNNEVVDVLKTDVAAEMSQGAPPASASMEEMINYIYRKLRNKEETTNTSTITYADNGTTELFKSTLSDDGTIFTKSEAISGT